ncbi:MAG: hypothetical protein H0X31_05345 [Nostocaceae cyanobacterium]|nr:hypothetical protein [Nostocaceae cyanobacterium]
MVLMLLDALLPLLPTQFLAIDDNTELLLYIQIRSGIFTVRWSSTLPV